VNQAKNWVFHWRSSLFFLFLAGKNGRKNGYGHFLSMISLTDITGHPVM
jgi:hypothetical protein